MFVAGECKFGASKGESMNIVSLDTEKQQKREAVKQKDLDQNRPQLLMVGFEIALRDVWHCFC